VKAATRAKLAERGDLPPGYVVIESGVLTRSGRELAPNGKRADVYRAWIRVNLDAAGDALCQLDLARTDVRLAAVLTHKLLTPPAWNDLDKREQWFEFVFKIVREEMA
jgi:hypothetical protein